jgi:hypothetical protein
MRGGRASPSVIRNSQYIARQMRQAMFTRSAAKLTRDVKANVRELTGREIRQIRPSSNPQPTLPRSTTGQIIEQMADLLGDLMEQKGARDAISKVSSVPRRDQFGSIASALGLPRDADGNVILVDDQDRPFVYVNGGEIVYVRVYKARIAPKGTSLDARCTVANPDGNEEVLLVEPVPSLKPDSPF